MAEKEVKVKVTTDVDKSDVEDLEQTLQQIQDNKVNIPVDADTSELEEVTSQIEEAKSELKDLQAKVEVDNSEIESLESELADLEAQRLDLDVEVDWEQLEVLDSQIGDIQNSLSSLQASVEVDSSEIESLEAEISDLEQRQIDLTVNVDSTGLDEVNSKLDETESKSQSTASSIDGVGSALTAVAGAAGLDQMVTTADNINNSWNRLSLTFANTGVSIDQLKAKQSELQASTGQTGGTIRNFFNDMGIAGVTNTNLLGSAFEALSGKAYQTGSSVEEMESKFQRMVMSGNASSRMLVSMGISAQDLANAMGVSADQVSEAFKNMTPEERIQALTKAMGEGKEANEMYKNSFQGLKTQADAAFAGLIGAVGQAILPVVIPMLKLATEAITGLTNAFKNLPGPVQAIIGGLGGVALAGATLIGTLGVVGQIIGTVKNGISVLTGIMKTWELVTKAVEIAQAALNLVMSLNPIFLVVAAIVALIAILWYLYNTNESVRAAIDGFAQALWGIGEAIYGSIQGAIQWLIDSLTWLWETITGLFTGTSTEGTSWLTTMIMVLMGPIGWIMLLIQNFNTLAPAIRTALAGMYQAAANWFNQTGQRISSFASNMVSQLGNGARNAVSSFRSGISGLYSAMTGELDRMLGAVGSWISQVISRFYQAGVDFVNALKRGMGIGSPGYMFYMMEGELGRIEHIVKDNKIPDSVYKLGASIVDSFSVNNGLSFNGGSTGNTPGGQVVNVEYNFNLYGDIDNEDRMQKFIDAVRRDIEWNNETAGRDIDAL